MRWLFTVALIALLGACRHADRVAAPGRPGQQHRLHGARASLARGVIQDHHSSIYYHRGRWYLIPGHVHGPGCGHVRIRGVWRLVSPSDERPLCR